MLFDPCGCGHNGARRRAAKGDLGGMDNRFSREEWIAYYSNKRITHQWTQLYLLSRVPCRRVLEVGPAMGLVTALLANAGYEVTTLDREARRFAEPDVPHLEHDITRLAGAAIAGFDAILCCETLEHIDWGEVGAVLREFRASGARHLIVSVPYMAFQVTFDLYANRRTLRHYFSLKKLLWRREFRREPPGGHQWEIGYKGFPLRRWEDRLRECGWRILAREFTGHTRSVFHLLEAA
jgi:SAM-dependent methyltransferase